MASVKAQRQRRAWAGWGQREGQQEWRSIGVVGDRGAHHGGWRSRSGPTDRLLVMSRARGEGVRIML